jgi:hypothetical protein
MNTQEIPEEEVQTVKTLLEGFEVLLQDNDDPSIKSLLEDILEITREW